MSKKSPPPADETVELSVDALIGIVELTKAVLTAAQYALLMAAIHKLALVANLLQDATASIRRMRRLFANGWDESASKLFGTTKKGGKEVTDEAVAAAPVDGGDQGSEAGKDEASAAAAAPSGGQKPIAWRRKRKKGQKPKGKYAAEDYVGGERVPIPSPLLAGDAVHECPACLAKSKFYHSKIVLHPYLTGSPAVQATVFEREQARCASCEAVFTAPTPPEVGEEKYAKSVAATLGIEHYESGVPFHTIEQRQMDHGVPLPAGTQFGLLKDATAVYQHVLRVLRKRAADGHTLWSDDTNMKILRLTVPQRAAALELFDKEKDAPNRTGIFTTAIQSQCDEGFVALLITGANHAGENLAELLTERDADLPPPLLMTDGAQRNIPKIPGLPALQERLKVIESQCNAHARRGFTDLIDSHKDEVETYVNLIGKVYAVDDRAKELGLSPAERLKLHRAESAPIMKELKEWLDQQKLRHEPNSVLGRAIKYVLDRWERLTRFLHTENAPVDNNASERLVKAQIRLRKRSMFYMTLDGAGVGDAHLSLIQTCKLNGVRAYPYLLALLENEAAVIARPWEWLPWNYQRALERKKGARPEPPALAARAA
jgi:transposase